MLEFEKRGTICSLQNTSINTYREYSYENDKKN